MRGAWFRGAEACLTGLSEVINTPFLPSSDVKHTLSFSPEACFLFGLTILTYDRVCGAVGLEDQMEQFVLF